MTRHTLLTALLLTAWTAAVRADTLDNAKAVDLLPDSAVQHDLGLSADQLGKIPALVEALHQEPDAAKARAAVAKLLSAAQVARLAELRIQRLGGLALAGDMVAAKLKLTSAQQAERKKALAANAAAEAEMNDFLARARFRSAEARDEYIEGYRTAARDRLLAILTAEQKKQLEALQGQPLAEVKAE